MSIIVSILDNDFYKFSMQYAVIKLFPQDKCRYEFINRNNLIFNDSFLCFFKKNVNDMKFLKLQKSERKYLEKFYPFFDKNYLDFLESYRFDPKEVHIKHDIHGKLKIIIEGFWFRTILWEVPLMAMISELYYKFNYENYNVDYQHVLKKTKKKIYNFIKMNILVSELGTRRRFSYKIHEQILKLLIYFGKKNFIGSSNVYLSKINNIKSIGTHSHEWFMFHTAKYNFESFTYLALKNWFNIYPNNHNIALSDTYTSNFFFKKFNKKFSILYKGLRHDSGDPILFIKKAIKHYKKFNIDPSQKIIVFSDNLNNKKIKKITNFCKGKIQSIFGIGTNLTNDVGLKPINIVIKMTNVCLYNSNKWIPVVKISDDFKKTSGNYNTISFIKEKIKKY